MMPAPTEPAETAADGDPGKPRVFHLDMPDDLYAKLRCQFCTGDVIAVEEEVDDETLTLARTHDLDCPELARIRAARAGRGE